MLLEGVSPEVVHGTELQEQCGSISEDRAEKNQEFRRSLLDPKEYDESLSTPSPSPPLDDHSKDLPLDGSFPSKIEIASEKFRMLAAKEVRSPLEILYSLPIGRYYLVTLVLSL